MALKFMVIGLPRSGTTWAANWLSTDDCLVTHDPLYRAHYSEWNEKFQAVSCTGIWRWPEWVNAQPCPKLILHRPEDEIFASLGQLGLADAIQPGDSDKLYLINGHHVDMKSLMEHGLAAHRAWRHLRPDVPFNGDRWQHYAEMNVQPQCQRIMPDHTTTQRLVDELFDMAKNRR